MEVSIGGALNPSAGLPGHDQQLHVRRRAGDCADRRRWPARNDIAERFRAKAAEIKRLVQEKLWDAEAQFFKVLPRGEDTTLSDAREQHGFTPWYFNLPTPTSRRLETAHGPAGFFAPFGPTTAEQRHPDSRCLQGHECQWNGPVGPTRPPSR